MRPLRLTEVVLLALQSVCLMAELRSEPSASLSLQESTQTMRQIAALPLVYRLPGMDKVTVSPDLKYTATSNPVLLMDAYRSPNIGQGKRRPGVVFIHGSVPPGTPAKNMGSLRSWGRLAAASGMIGITFTHRLGYPDPRLKEAANDVQVAIDHVRTHAEAFDLDPDRLCLVAFSGGGPLLSMTMRDPPPYFVVS